MSDPTRSISSYELALYFDCYRQMTKIYQAIVDDQALLKSAMSPSVRSPRIKSKAEAKYQRGTRVYLEDEPIQRLQQIDQINARLAENWRKYNDRAATVCRIGAVIIAASFDAEQLDLIFRRFYLMNKVQVLAERKGYAYQTIYKKFNQIYDRYYDAKTSI